MLNPFFEAEAGREISNIFLPLSVPSQLLSSSRNLPQVPYKYSSFPIRTINSSRYICTLMSVGLLLTKNPEGTNKQCNNIIGQSEVSIGMIESVI